MLRQLTQDQSCTLIGVVDVRKEALSEAAATGLKVAPRLDDLLDECDAVDIVTPTNTHYEIAKKCLNAGKDVFVEKPLTATSAEAGELVPLAGKSQCILAVGHILRYNPVVSHIKSKLLGELGPIEFVDGRYIGTPGPRADSGTILNLGIHLVDLYSYILGEEPIQVMAQSRKFSFASRFEDHAVLTMWYPSGTVGYATVSWLNSHKAREILLVGKERALAADFVDNSFSVSERSRAPSKPTQISGLEPLVAELTDFLNSVRERSKPISDAAGAVSTLMTIEKAYASSKLGRAIRFDQ